MSYGFEATNNSGQVLVSSDTKNLHFIQRITGPRNTTLSDTDLDAGVIASYDYWGGIRRWRYTATCSTTPVPFFTIPRYYLNPQYHGVNGGMFGYHAYAITRLQNKGNNRWDIEIGRTGLAGSGYNWSANGTDNYFYATYNPTNNRAATSFKGYINPSSNMTGNDASTAIAITQLNYYPATDYFYVDMKLGLSSGNLQTYNADSGFPFTTNGYIPPPYVVRVIEVTESSIKVVKDVVDASNSSYTFTAGTVVFGAMLSNDEQFQNAAFAQGFIMPFGSSNLSDGNGLKPWTSRYILTYQNPYIGISSSYPTAITSLASKANSTLLSPYQTNGVHNNYKVDIPWAFRLRGTYYNTFYVSSSGYITFEPGLYAGDTDYAFDRIYPYKFPGRDGFHFAPAGFGAKSFAVRYQLTGTSPNRVAIMRWEGTMWAGAATGLGAAQAVVEFVFSEATPSVITINVGDNDSYTGGLPQLYIFADPKASTATESHGMIVYQDDGVTPSFDSRLKPLLITGGTTITHPYEPIPSGYYGTNLTYDSPYLGEGCGQVANYNPPQGAYQLESNFSPTNFTKYDLPLTKISKPIYNYYSLAQTEREAAYFHNAFWPAFPNSFYDQFRSYYWMFYRGGIKPYYPTNKNYYDTKAGRGAWTQSSSTYLNTTGLSEHPSTGYSTDNTTALTNAGVTITRYGNWLTGYWKITLPWSTKFSNATGTGSESFNTVYVTTASYILFQEPTQVYISGHANPQSILPNCAKLFLLAGFNTCNNVGVALTGTAPNRVLSIRYYGYASLDANVAGATPNLVWTASFRENFTDAIFVDWLSNYPTSTNSGPGTGPALGLASATEFLSGGGKPYLYSGATNWEYQKAQVFIPETNMVYFPENAPAINSGWISTVLGCYSTKNGSTSFLGVSLGSGIVSGGRWPYSNETLNLQNNNIIVSDATYYDLD